MPMLKYAERLITSDWSERSNGSRSDSECSASARRLPAPTRPPLPPLIKRLNEKLNSKDVGRWVREGWGSQWTSGPPPVPFE